MLVSSLCEGGREGGREGGEGRGGDDTVPVFSPPRNAVAL